MTRDAYICDALRTPFGRYGGALSGVPTTTWPRCRSRR
jgi:acetyl-CoA acetyltransferase